MSPKKNRILGCLMRKICANDLLAQQNFVDRCWCYPACITHLICLVRVRITSIDIEFLLGIISKRMRLTYKMTINFDTWDV